MLYMIVEVSKLNGVRVDLRMSKNSPIWAESGLKKEEIKGRLWKDLRRIKSPSSHWEKWEESKDNN